MTIVRMLGLGRTSKKEKVIIPYAPFQDRSYIMDQSLCMFLHISWQCLDLSRRISFTVPAEYPRRAFSEINIVNASAEHRQAAGKTGRLEL